MPLECKKCGSCCRFLFVRVKKETVDTFWMNVHNIKTIYIDEEDVGLLIPVKCNQLDGENQCSIYSTRPQTCKDYPIGQHISCKSEE